MSTKSILISLSLALLVLLGGYFFLSQETPTASSEQEQIVITETYRISVMYVSLRERTDTLLRSASTYPSFEVWQTELVSVIQDWQELETLAFALEKEADALVSSDTSLSLVPKAYASEQYELSAIFDAAPAGQKIKTLAKHLGTDAKTAYKLLQIEQAQIEADGWNEAGNTFKDLETKATVLKDACKVTTFVGTIVATGGLATVASASTLSQAAVVVSGADLVLEVTNDVAQIGLGDKNKISSVINDIRIVSEPVASVLTITSLHENIGTGFEKFNAVVVALEQFNNAAQEGKIAGVKLPVYKPGVQEKEPVVVSTLTPEEVSEWIQAQGGTETNPGEVSSSIQKALSIIESLPEPSTQTETTPISVSESNTSAEAEASKDVSVSGACSVVGTWEGVMKWTSSANEPESEKLVIYTFATDGTVFLDDELMGTYDCINSTTVHIFKPDAEEDGYHEFSLSGDMLTFIKIAGPDEEGTWSEVFAGDDFFGGKYLTLTLERQ